MTLIELAWEVQRLYFPNEKKPFTVDALLRRLLSKKGVLFTAKEPEETSERIKKFHDHLDICNQCERHPFDLCPEGAKLLKYAATGQQ